MKRDDVVIVSTARTPIGRAHKGSLRDVRADDLGAIAVRAVLDQLPALDPAQVDDVVVGCAVPEGQQGFGIARAVGLLAGLPVAVPGLTVSRACASSLQAIRSAAHAIAAGEAEVVIAGGVESVSKVPVPLGHDDLNPRLCDPAADGFVTDLFASMLQTAENVAARHDVSRVRMDEFAALSQARAVAARELHDARITPVPLADGSVVATDDCPRPGTTAEALAALAPVLGPAATVTAGNSCPLNDGAAAVAVMSAGRAADLGIRPMARIVASAVTGLEPATMGVGPIAAVERLLASTGHTIGDIDVVELNEAFAAQVLAVVDALGIDIERQLNPFGGAIALGHPFGMTGARIMTTLLDGLEARDQELGIETMCIGGGMGMAMLVQRL
ncbi:acetyl-CoA C-acyltransferase [Nocardioides sp. SLBN-35]|jgi:acetyl-CoA C-acetyltransferase|uniref:acetyl-CoA C-acyltransferase n=1 Tax=Nocardioides sp. SLBN-35 TaxID=2768445 RepID=UPI00115420B0|nr:acetyl-CoA C-acyltransferase [Nocardioides sp. SLBN-35]TQK68995.1 acetyl-CoA C-acetyltransferase [Nocardioides sp. SLBN-35]